MGEGNANFEIFATQGRARLGRFHTAHGSFNTPAFMPVGTQGTVKGVLPRDIAELGAEIILSNTYHLHLRPGEKLIEELGGLHRFMNWPGPILTDSGGYQVFSLSGLRKLSDEGVEFQSHHDGAKVFFSPEKVIEIQERLGVDIAMVLDECLPYPSTEEAAERSLELTLRWAERSQKSRSRKELTQVFGIVQGGMYPRLREMAAKELVKIGFDGYAIGGLSVGEPSHLLYEFAEISASYLPSEKIRYLMGVGTPLDIIKAVSVGIDLFDCVIPTRSARFGRLFTSKGHLNIRNAEHRSDARPIEEGCGCYACQHFSRAYISHLVHAKEILGVGLATLHNLFFYQQLMRRIRGAIASGDFIQFCEKFTAEYRGSEDSSEVSFEDGAQGGRNESSAD